MNRLILSVISLAVSLGVSAQKFYYEGGYFQKIGDKWYEYRPQEKAGVWNSFVETTSFDSASYYVIDNGNCKVAVPKTTSKDFLIQYKGRDKWNFKYKRVDDASSMVKAPFVSRSNRVRDRLAFHRAYFNEGGVCILAAYCLLLEYANSTDAVIADFDSYDVMSKYMEYHNTLEPKEQKSAQYIRDNHKNGEKYVSDAINGYCMRRGWSGLVQLVNFHNWLAENENWAAHVEVVEHGIRRIGKMGNTRDGLSFAYQNINEYLKRNTDVNGDSDYASVIVYYVPEVSAFHAVFLGYDSDGYFMRGPNFFDKFTDNVCDFDFRFCSEAQVVDYLVMKIKRPPENLSHSGWKTYAYETFVSDVGVLKNPIPVKSIRINPTLRGDGVLKFVSRSNPSFIVEMGNGIGSRNLRVNGIIKQYGRDVSNGMVEFDIKQICPDLEIVSFSPTFNFKDFKYQ